MTMKEFLDACAAARSSNSSDEDRDGAYESLTCMVSDGLEVIVGHDALREMVVLSSTVGRVEDEEETASFRSMFMELNGHWDQLGGLRFACLEDGEFQVLLELPVRGMSEEELTSAVADVAERADFWRGALAKGAPRTPDDTHDSAAIKV